MAPSVRKNPSRWDKEKQTTEDGCQKLDCHVAWVEEMVPRLLAPNKKEILFQEVIHRIRDWIKDSKDVIVSDCTTLNIRLMMAAFNAHLSNYSEALDWISEATEYIESMVLQKEQHGQGYRYLIGTNFCTITNMMCLNYGMNVDDSNNEMIQSLRNTYDGGDNIFKAVIANAKGMLAHQMQCQDSQIFLFREATELDPETAEWHRALYKGLRHQRRKVFPVPGPTKEERDAITKAYDLDPDCCLNLSHYACWLDEQMKGRRDFFVEETKESIADEVIDLMVRAIEKNPEDRWAHVRLAEVYGYGAYPHLDEKKGEALFEECEERWPDSSMVLHKFGKYYSIHYNWTKALDYYTRGLNADLGNFPCLMDYLKCLPKNYNADNQRLDMIDRCLPVHAFNRLQLSKLLLAKGLVFWRMERKWEASDLLIEAATTGSERSTIAKTITRGHWDIIGKYEVNIDELIDIMCQMLPSKDADSNEENEKKTEIKNLISDLRSSESRVPAYHHPYNRNRSPPRLRYRSDSVCSLDSTVSARSSDSFVTAKSFWSIGTSTPSTYLSDDDDNWRVGCGSAPEPRGGFYGFKQHQNERYDSLRNAQSRVYYSSAAQPSSSVVSGEPLSGQTKGPYKKSKSKGNAGQSRYHVA